MNLSKFKHQLLLLFDYFRSTNYGKVLSQMMRYDRYKPQEVISQEWEEMFGLDVNNLKHHLFTLELAEKLIAKESIEKISLEQRKQIMLMAVTHDWAEAVVGDPSYDLKDEEHEKKEIKVLKKLGGEMIEQTFGGHEKGAAEKNPDRGLKDLFLKTVDEVLAIAPKDPKNKELGTAGKAFNAVERLGYLDTGIKAWQFAKQARKENNHGLALNLEWMIDNVFLNQIPALIEYSHEFIYINEYLSNHRDAITEAFKEHDNKSFSLYGAEEDRKRKLFIKAKGFWINKFA